MKKIIGCISLIILLAAFVFVLYNSYQGRIVSIGSSKDNIHEYCKEQEFNCDFFKDSTLQNATQVGDIYKQIIFVEKDYYCKLFIEKNKMQYKSQNITDEATIQNEYGVIDLKREATSEKNSPDSNIQTHFSFKTKSKTFIGILAKGDDKEKLFTNDSIKEIESIILKVCLPKDTSK